MAEASAAGSGIGKAKKKVKVHKPGDDVSEVSDQNSNSREFLLDGPAVSPENDPPPFSLAPEDRPEGSEPVLYNEEAEQKERSLTAEQS